MPGSTQVKAGKAVLWRDQSHGTIGHAYTFIYNEHWVGLTAAPND